MGSSWKQKKDILMFKKMMTKNHETHKLFEIMMMIGSLNIWINFSCLHVYLPPFFALLRLNNIFGFKPMKNIKGKNIKYVKWFIS